MIVSKMTEKQAKQYCEDQQYEWDYSSSLVRECSCCDMYVSVDDISSEIVINESTYFDVCDQCSCELEKEC